MLFVDGQLFLWDKIFQKLISHCIHVQAKAISSGIFVKIRDANTVFSTHWVPNSTRKNLSKYLIVLQHNSTSSIYIELCIWDLLTQLQLIPTMIIYRNRLRLVATCPNNKVSILHVDKLFLRTDCFDQLNALVFATFNLLIQTLRVPAEPCE